MKILVVVDMQNDFVDGALGSKEAQAIVPNVCEKIKYGHYDHIIVTHDTHFDNYLETLEGQKLPVPHCQEGTSGWELNEKVAHELNARRYRHKVSYISKYTFGTTDVPERINFILTQEGCMEDPEIDFCGLCTDICVVSNALIARAYFRNAPITVDANCCAGVTPEKHKAALEVMKSCQIDVINE